MTDSLTNRYLPASTGRWSPDSGETIAERLGMIVAAAMGYEPEDLPWEVPLIELGLDSLMAVRIKNRVEYDFDLPPIQLTAVRDANLYAVEKLIEYAIEHRDEVEQLHEHRLIPDARGEAEVALVNDRLGMGVAIRWPLTALPRLIQWSHLREGGYAVGLEPATHRPEGTDPPVLLEHGESREYRVTIRVLPSAAAIRGFEAASAGR